MSPYHPNFMIVMWVSLTTVFCIVFFYGDSITAAIYR